jgi:hypothetical protein
MRRTQCHILLRVTSLRLRCPSLLLHHPVLPHNIATRGLKGGEGRGGKMWQRSTTVAQSRSSRFLNFSSFRMGRLRHTAPSLRLFISNSLTVSHHSFLPRAVLATFVAGVLFHSDHSPTATSAPSLDQLVPSGSLISYQQVRVITVIKIFLLSSQSLCEHNHPKFSLSLFLFHPRVGALTHAPTFPALTPFTIFSVLEEVYLSTRSFSLFFITYEKFRRFVL